VATRQQAATGLDSAPAGGFTFGDDERAGITRRRAGTGWSYRDPRGRAIRDPATTARIRALAIPPAWTDVWIAPSEREHLQATGRDALGRKQYRYHPAWRRRRDDEKFDRLLRFARRLPAIRRRVDRDLRLPGMPREKVLAAVVRLLELTFIRVGNDEYARLYRSFGLTTLRNRHATVRGSTVRFRFRGKSKVLHDVTLEDRRLAAVVRRCRELPGQELFAYTDEDGTVRDVASDDVNAYLREIGDADITAKDFRTWAGTVLAVRALRRGPKPEDEKAARASVVAAVEATAEQLGNTPAVTRSSYVHPAVLDGYLDEDVRAALYRAVGAPARRAAGSADEAALIRLLRRAARSGVRARAAAGARPARGPRTKQGSARRAGGQKVSKSAGRS
jgi:DNA topoisomerase-1